MRWLLVTLVISAMFQTSGCGSGSKRTEGTEKGPCYPNHTCNAGLTCLSELCVNAGPATSTDAGVGTDGLTMGTAGVNGGESSRTAPVDAGIGGKTGSTGGSVATGGMNAGGATGVGGTRLGSGGATMLLASDAGVVVDAPSIELRPSSDSVASCLVTVSVADNMRNPSTPIGPADTLTWDIPMIIGGVTEITPIGVRVTSPTSSNNTGQIVVRISGRDQDAFHLVLGSTPCKAGSYCTASLKSNSILVYFEPGAYGSFASELSVAVNGVSSDGTTPDAVCQPAVIQLSGTLRSTVDAGPDVTPPDVWKVTTSPPIPATVPRNAAFRLNATITTEQTLTDLSCRPRGSTGVSLDTQFTTCTSRLVAGESCVFCFLIAPTAMGINEKTIQCSAAGVLKDIPVSFTAGPSI